MKRSGWGFVQSRWLQLLILFNEDCSKQCQKAGYLFWYFSPYKQELKTDSTRQKRIMNIPIYFVLQNFTPTLQGPFSFKMFTLTLE